MSEDRVVFFGADGDYAERVFEGLNEKYAPVAYCDLIFIDSVFMGLPILSIEDVESRYRGCRYYITVDTHTKPLAIRSLVDGGVDRSRIINFEAFKRYVSCHELESQLCYVPIKGSPALSFCCPGTGENQSPFVPIDGASYNEALGNFFAMRDRVIEDMNLSKRTKQRETPCFACPKLKDGLWRAQRRIDLVKIGSPDVFPDRSENLCAEGAPAFLRFLKGGKAIDANTEIHLAAGVSDHPLFGDVLAEVRGNPCKIFTDAVAYSEKIGEMLSWGRSSVCVRMDAGTRATFAKTKGADAFDKVCETLARYSLGGPVHLKYTILPGLNDNEDDVSGFINLCGRVKPRAVDVSRDTQDAVPFSDHTIDTAARLVDALRRCGIKVSLLDFSSKPYDLWRIEKNEIHKKNTNHEIMAICCAEAARSKVMAYTYAYNAEKTLARAIESVLAQTFGDFTYYIVDNGSSDSTGDIIRAYADRDKRIVPLVNTGNHEWRVGNAFYHLTKGFDSTSYYFTLDADDEYRSDFLEKIFAFAQKYDLDIAVAGSDYIDADSMRTVEQKIIGEELICEGRAFADEFMRYRSLINAPWNKLYKCAVITKLNYCILPRMTFANDSFLMLRYLRLTKRVGFLPQPLHKYYIYPNSHSRFYNFDRLNDFNIFFRLYKNFLEGFGPISPLNLDYLYAIWLGWMDDYMFRPLRGHDIPTISKMIHISKIFASGVTKAMLRRNADPRFRNLASRDVFLRGVCDWLQSQEESKSPLGNALVREILDNMDVSRGAAHV